MKKSKIILSSFVVGTIFLTPYTIHLSNLNESNSSILTENKGEAAIIPWLQKLIWPIAKAGFTYGSNQYYSVIPSVSYDTYADSITPGSIYFNSTSGSGAYFDFNLASANHSVNIYAEAPFYQLFTGKISVILENPNRQWAINRSVNPTQWSTYTPGLLGSYRAIWVQNATEKWTPYLVYRHNRGYIVSFNTPNQDANLLSKNTASAKSDNKTEISEHLITIEKYGNIVKPSKSHKTLEANRPTMPIYLTAEALDQQFIDPELGVHVYALRDYDVGDVVYFKDILRNIEFDVENKNTILTFDGLETDYKLYFSENLTKNYKIGEELTLKFKVESLEKSADEIALIDYFKFALDNNNKAPKIKQFLVK